tara:strand:+ start:148 stop:276 length:129 start_codon:yes stop_codon:yes gene_type:complete
LLVEEAAEGQRHLAAEAAEAAVEDGEHLLEQLLVLTLQVQVL